MDEDIVTIFYNNLHSANNPATYLTGMYAALFALPFDSKNIPLFGKLVKIFGRTNVFLSMVDMAFVSDFDPRSNFYPLIVYICKKRLEEYTKTKRAVGPTIDVDALQSSIEKQRRKSLKIRSPFNE